MLWSISNIFLFQFDIEWTTKWKWMWEGVLRANIGMKKDVGIGRFKHFKHFRDRPIDQLTKQPTNQPTNQTTDQLTDLSSSRCVRWHITSTYKTSLLWIYLQRLFVGFTNKRRELSYESLWTTAFAFPNLAYVHRPPFQFIYILSRFQPQRQLFGAPNLQCTAC